MDMSWSKLLEVVKDREAGVLQSVGSQRIRYDLASKHTNMRSTTYYAVSLIIKFVPVFMFLPP